MKSSTESMLSFYKPKATPNPGRFTDFFTDIPGEIAAIPELFKHPGAAVKAVWGDPFGLVSCYRSGYPKCSGTTTSAIVSAPLGGLVLKLLGRSAKAVPAAKDTKGQPKTQPQGLGSDKVES